MSYEIERKFLVKNTDFIQEAKSKYYIVQAFLNSTPERTVRIRIKDDLAFLTIKGKSNVEGTTRAEWEYEIPVVDAQAMLKLCEPGSIEKYRYIIPIGEHEFEVDVFEGENSGLIVAEVELESADEVFEKPNWLGEEVTGDVRYYNSNLSKKPFKEWDMV